MKSSTKFLIGLLIVLLIAAGGLFVWQKYFTDEDSPTAKTAVGTEKDKVTIGMTRITTALYPETPYEFYAYNANMHIFEPLATFNRENQVIPVLATKWDNPDNLTWRFYISPKATFSNGQPVTADDIKFTYEYLMEKKLPTAEALPAIENIVVNDQKTIEFKTPEANPLFLNQIAMALLVISKKEIEANGTKNYIGSGTYKLVNLDKQELSLTRNENYWGEKPKVKNVVYKLLADEAAKIDGLLAGEIDLTSYGFSDEVALGKLQQAITAGKVQKAQALDQSVTMLLLDTISDKNKNINLDTNPLKNVAVRQALYQAINTQDLVSNIYLEGKEATQLVGSSIFGYNPKIKPLSHDVTAAKSSMTEAGYPNGFDMTIDYADLPGAAETYAPLVAQLKEININLTLNPLDGEELLAKIQSRQTSAAIFTWSEDTLDSYMALGTLVHTKTEELGLFNLGYGNIDVDKLIDEATGEMNQKIRLEKLQEAMKISMDEVAIIPLYQSNLGYSLSNSLLWKPRLDSAYRAWEMAGKN